MNASQAAGSPQSGGRTWGAVTLLVLGVYLAYATHFAGRVALPVHPNGLGTYDALAESLLAGRLDIRMTPADARVQDIRFDLSVYQERYYLYWGVAPAALLYAPYRAVFGRGLPDAWAAFAFLFGTYLFGSVLLLRIHSSRYYTLGPRALGATLAVLGLANLSLYMLKQARIYEVAASGGLFFFIAGLCLLAHWRLDRARTPSADETGAAKLALASLCFGLSLLTRPTHAVAIALLLALTGMHLWRCGDHRRGARLAWLATPAAICFGLWCFYNWSRFGHPLETGQALAQNGLPTQKFYVLSVFRGCYLQLLQPPLLSPQPPFIRSLGMDAVARALTFGLPGYAWNSIGLWFMAPFVLILPVAVPRAIRALRQAHGATAIAGDDALGFIKLALGISLACTLLVLLCFAYSDLRYTADYLSTALLLSALAWFGHLERTARQAPRRGLAPFKVMTLAVVWSILVNVVVGFFLL